MVSPEKQDLVLGVISPMCSVPTSLRHTKSGELTHVILAVTTHFTISVAKTYRHRAHDAISSTQLAIIIGPLFRAFAKACSPEK